MPNGKDDLTTLLVAHLATLRAASAQNAADLSGAFARDIPTMEATQARANNDTNADYFVYLQTNS